jgi:hypothetical protein
MDTQQYIKSNQFVHIVFWDCKKMKKHVNKKFNQKGFFICKKNNEGIYNKLLFGKKFNFEDFIENIKNGKIYLDSGMYHDENKKNNRLYSTWRADRNFWYNLIIEEF